MHHIYIYICIHIYTPIHINIDVYIYICICILYVYIHMYIHKEHGAVRPDTTLRMPGGGEVHLGKAPKGNGIGATGSRKPRAYKSPCFSLLGMVLRTWVWF